MSKIYIGIDPGAKGFVSIHFPDGSWEFISISDNDLYEITDKLDIFVGNAEIPVVAVMEDVSAIYGSSAKGTFNFGFNKGYLIGILCAMKIPYVLVKPTVWQKEIWIRQDEVYIYKDGKKKHDTKNTSINACKRLFPYLDLKRTPSCKLIDDNKVDSILMSEYARRKNL